MPAALDPLVDELIAHGVAEKVRGQIRLTAAGKLAAAELFARDRSAVGEARALAMLDEFHALDARMKSLVTAWQVREVAAEQVLNDHTDAAYDAQIMDDLERPAWRLTATWLVPWRTRCVGSTCIELVGTGTRPLRAGDQRFVASPRVDSYHSVWFELHEDLIRLSGKKRSEATTG